MQAFLMYCMFHRMLFEPLSRTCIDTSYFRLQGHSKNASSALDTNGSMILSGGTNGEILLWQLQDMTETMADGA